MWSQITEFQCQHFKLHFMFVHRRPLFARPVTAAENSSVYCGHNTCNVVHMLIIYFYLLMLYSTSAEGL